MVYKATYICYRPFLQGADTYNWAGSISSSIIKDLVPNRPLDERSRWYIEGLGYTGMLGSASLTIYTCVCYCRVYHFLEETKLDDLLRSWTLPADLSRLNAL